MARALFALLALAGCAASVQAPISHPIRDPAPGRAAIVTGMARVSTAVFPEFSGPPPSIVYPYVKHAY